MVFQLNGKEVATLKVSQAEMGAMEAEEALQRAHAVERFVNLLGKWQVSGVTLDRKQDYQLDVYVSSNRSTDPTAPAQNQQQPQKSKKPKKSKKSKEGEKDIAHA